MRRLALSLMSIAIGLGVAKSALAEAPFVVSLLSTPREIDAACSSLDQIGIRCVDGAESASPDHLSKGRLPLSTSEYSLFDQGDRPAVRGFLIKEKLLDDAGNPYFHATAAVYKTGFAGVGITDTELYNKPFWTYVGQQIPLAFPGSSEERQFLARMDAQVVAEREASDRKAAAEAARKSQRAATAAAAASEAAYRASPQYAADTATRAVDTCRADIARARAAIAKDDRVAQISGYQNALLRRQAAIIIVNCEDTIARGGK